MEENKQVWNSDFIRIAYFLQGRMLLCWEISLTEIIHCI